MQYKGFRKIEINGLLQLALCSLLLFVFPFFSDEVESFLMFWGLTSLLFVSATLIQNRTYHFREIALSLIVIRVITSILDLQMLETLVNLAVVAFFAWVSLALVKQVMQKEQGPEAIVDAIAGYLLLGISLTLVMAVIQHFDPNAFTEGGSPLVSKKNYFSSNSYFVFMTYTTVGYGDIIPVSDAGRAFSKFTAILGQIYISVVIAILIGKSIKSK